MFSLQLSFLWRFGLYTVCTSPGHSLQLIVFCQSRWSNPWIEFKSWIPCLYLLLLCTHNAFTIIHADKHKQAYNLETCLDKKPRYVLLQPKPEESMYLKELQTHLLHDLKPCQSWPKPYTGVGTTGAGGTGWQSPPENRHHYNTRSLRAALRSTGSSTT